VKVFISYSHQQREWVLGRLELCLRAGGAEVLIDRQQFRAGPGVIRQMDAIQDRAERHVLVLSRDYMGSPYCLHEMERAIALDPGFQRQLVIPVRRDDAELPDLIKQPEAIYVDLRDECSAEQWQLLLDGCGASLGIAVPAWLEARDDVVRLMRQDKSVNLVVKGTVKWDPLVDDLVASLKLAQVDLMDPATASRRGLVKTILAALGWNYDVPPPPEDLPEFADVLNQLGRSRLVLRHFDMILNRPDYGINLWTTLSYMVMNTRQLVILAQSRTPLAALLPHNHPISNLQVETVELRAHP
jgi:TIR domain